MMFNAQMLNTISLMCLLLIVCVGCAHPDGNITSKKLPDYTQQPAKIYIRAAMNGTTKIKGGFFNEDHDETDVMASIMTTALKGCGIDSKFLNVDPLDVTNTEANLIKEYQPDDILSIAPTVGMTKYNIISTMTYHVELIDMKSRTAVWKAEVQVNKMRAAGRVLSNLILGNLQLQNIIPASCQPQTGGTLVPTQSN